MAVCEVFLEWDQVRDYFPAFGIALKLNRPGSSRVTTPEDILAYKYRLKKSVMITQHDPDHGALGDWQSLRGNLKDRTEALKKRRKGYGRA